MKHATETDGHPWTKLSLTRTGFQKHSDEMCSNQMIQGREMLFTACARSMQMDPQRWEIPSLSRSHWWKRRRLVLFWSAMNRMHALALAGWPTGFVLRASTRKIQPRDSSYHFRLLVFGGCKVQSSDYFSSKKRRRKGSVSRCVVSIIQQEHSPVGTWNRTDYPMNLFFFTENYWIR